jgi:hypothetical protein
MDDIPGTRVRVYETGELKHIGMHAHKTSIWIHGGVVALATYIQRSATVTAYYAAVNYVDVLQAAEILYFITCRTLDMIQEEQCIILSS